MTIQLGVPDVTELRPRITVFGVGGAGGNAVNNMINANLEGVEFVVANTDAQSLSQSACDRRIQMGTAITEGLGAGSRPEIGRAAAEESIGEIMDHLSGCHMAFITAGMGGGTGTGAAPIIAQAAKEQGILTVGVVTKPFQFEGARRMRLAEAGIEEFQKFADTLLIIPNQNLFRIANENTTFAQAFAMADEVLHSGVRGVTDLMVMPGLINLDFADVRSIMNEMGKAMMGTGEAQGEKRAIEAAEAAISNPLLDDVSMKGARGVLINITGGLDLGLYEVDEAANRVRAEVDPDANIIVGSTFDEQLEGTMRVSVVATGIEIAEGIRPVEDVDVKDMQPPVRKVWSAGNAVPRSSVAAMTETIKEELKVKSEDEVGVEQPVAQASAAPVQEPAPVVLNQPVAEQPSAPAQTTDPSAPRLPLKRHGAPRAPLPPRVAQSAPAATAPRAPTQAPPPPVAQEPYESPEPKKQSVFDRMMAGVRSARTANRTQTQVRRAPTLGGAGTQTAPGAPQPPQQAAPVQPQRSVQQAAPAAQPAAPAEEDLFSVSEEEEQLEIPAFLRRQSSN